MSFDIEELLNREMGEVRIIRAHLSSQAVGSEFNGSGIGVRAVAGATVRDGTVRFGDGKAGDRGRQIWQEDEGKISGQRMCPAGFGVLFRILWVG